MAGVIKESLRVVFADIAKSRSAMKKLLNPTMEGAGRRIFPSRNSKNDEKYGVRLDKGEPVTEKEGWIMVNVQLNSNAANRTLRELARKNPHQKVASVAVNSKQEITQENLDKVLDEVLDKVED